MSEGSARYRLSFGQSTMVITMAIMKMRRIRSWIQDENDIPDSEGIVGCTFILQDRMLAIPSELIAE